jgi:hypothetical protein
MTDYQIQPNTRRCAITGRELQPGERFYTALLEDGDTFQRKDYCSEAWQGPPPGTFSFWSGRVPAEQGNRRPPIDDELLLDCFQRLEGQTDPARVNFRFVLALLLMRRKRLKFEDARREQAHEVLILRCTRTGATSEVVNPQLTEEAMAAVQDEVFRVLGWS